MYERTPKSLEKEQFEKAGYATLTRFSVDVGNMLLFRPSATSMQEIADAYIAKDARYETLRTNVLGYLYHPSFLKTILIELAQRYENHPIASIRAHAPALKDYIQNRLASVPDAHTLFDI